LKIRGVGLVLRLDSRDLKLSSKVQAETKAAAPGGEADARKR